MNHDPVARLEAEWNTLARHPLRRRLRGWDSVDRALRRFATGGEIVGFLHGEGTADDKDDVLYALVSVAPSEPFAARTALQALLPGLKTVSRRLFRRGSPRAEVWQLLLATAWERIVTYPLTRRPRRIAANLLLDTLHSALTQLTRERPNAVELTGRALPAQACSPHGDVDALLARAVALGVVSTADAELVLETRIDGRELADAADARDMPYNTVKVRRQRAERQLLMLLGLPAVPRGRQRRRSFPADRTPLSAATAASGSARL